MRVAGGLFSSSEEVRRRHARVESAARLRAVGARRRVPGRHLLVAVLQRRLPKMGEGEESAMVKCTFEILERENTLNMESDSDMERERERERDGR